MPNTQYSSYLLYLIKQGQPIKACLVSTTTGQDAESNYNYASTDQFFSIVPENSILSTSISLTNEINSSEIDPLVFPSVAMAPPQKVEAIIIWLDTDDLNTSPLLNYFDTGSNLPLSPNGSDITLYL